MEEFFLKFSEIFEDVDVASLSGDIEFRKLEEWDSIAALSVIGMADEEYGVTLSAEDMRSCVTISDLYEKVQSKK